MGAKEWILGTAVIAFAVNWLAVKSMGYPFVYCWCLPLQGFVEPWIFAAKLCAVGIFVMQMAWGKFLGAIGAATGVFLIFGLSTFFDLLFRLDASCA